MDINSVTTSVVGNNALSSGIKPAVEMLKPQQNIPTVAPNAAARQDVQKVSAEQITEINSNIEKLGVGIAFSVDESTQSSVIKVIDKSTNEVIKQYPNEGSLEVMKNIQGYLESLNSSETLSKEASKGSMVSELI